MDTYITRMASPEAQDTICSRPVSGQEYLGEGGEDYKEPKAEHELETLALQPIIAEDLFVMEVRSERITGRPWRNESKTFKIES